MKTVDIYISIRNHSHHTTFKSDCPEYAIADEAYRLALLFAETCVMAEYGHALSGHEFGLFLEDMDYGYTIS